MKQRFPCPMWWGKWCKVGMRILPAGVLPAKVPKRSGLSNREYFWMKICRRDKEEHKGAGLAIILEKVFVMKRYRRLTLERLEDRELLATWGMAWPNPQHVTVSFVPDGTAIGSAQSNLFQTLNSQASTSVWETTILQAIKTWAAATNISVSLTNDGGQPIGTSGMIQGDSRFGDIRISAEPLGSDVVAITAPFDLLGGARSGDIILNSSDFGSASAGLYDLFTVVLHEAGHSFGLADQLTDPSSVMYAQYSGVRTGLSVADIAQIQLLYGGPRTPDIWEVGG